jgi:hypothetical protein
MQTYQNKISLDFNSVKQNNPIRNIRNMDSISISTPSTRDIMISEEDISPMSQAMISPTMQVEQGAPETKSPASQNTNYQQPPTNKNQKGFMPPTPGNQIPGQAKSAGPRFSSEVLHSFPPDVKSSAPEWRLNPA